MLCCAARSSCTSHDRTSRRAVSSNKAGRGLGGGFSNDRDVNDACGCRDDVEMQERLENRLVINLQSVKLDNYCRVCDTR